MELMELLPYTVQYSGFVFAVGFVFGTVRAMWATAALGEEMAIVCEIPMMLLASWFIWENISKKIESTFVVKCDGDFCSRERRTVSQTDAVVAGLISFFYLLVYEFLLSKALLGETLATFVAKQFARPKLIGLMGQVVFGCIPLARCLTRRNEKLE